jgi:oligoendopeptidase F
MSTTPAGVKAEGVRWSLDELYSDPEDSRIDRDLRDARSGAEAFAVAYRGKIAGGELAPADLARALGEYEALLELAQKPSFYANLLFAADTQNLRAQRQVQRTREAATEISNLVVFFNLEWIAIEDARLDALMVHPELARYKHHISTLRRFKPYTLAEKEEQILNQKGLTGRSAFEQLYEELTGSLSFSVTVDGETNTLTDSEVLALLRSPDAAVREHALTVFLETYAGHALVLTSVFNNTFLDHKVDCDIRGYQDVVTPTHLANDISPTTVESMMTEVERHYSLAQEYFRIKAHLLGIKRLKNTDIYAPIENTAEKLPFDRARGLILGSFASFNVAFARIAGEFFDKRWIDAEVRAGKRGGAFCAAWTPNHHPYILCSYTGTGRDVSTLAHELGHGIHYTLSRKQLSVDFDAPLVLAETASVFAEITLTRHLLKSADLATRRAILCDLLEDIYGTVYRQTALTRFEMAAHRSRRSGPLTPDDLSELWLAEQKKLFGDSVEMIPPYRWGWAYISHFIHSRFYCYSYSFGELLTLALFQRYLDEGESFVPGYIRLLESGGSRRPADALAELGIDIDQPDFWARGFAVIEGFLSDLQATL